MLDNRNNGNYGQYLICSYAKSNEISPETKENDIMILCKAMRIQHMINARCKSAWASRIVLSNSLDMRPNIHGEQGQYHSSFCPNDFYENNISSHGNNYLERLWFFAYVLRMIPKKTMHNGYKPTVFCINVVVCPQQIEYISPPHLVIDIEINSKIHTLWYKRYSHAFEGWSRSLLNSPTHTVYPKKYAHGFCFAVLCCGYTLTDFPISIRLTSLALWQSSDCPSASKATLMNMDKYFMWIHYERLHNHNKAKHNKTVCIFLGIYRT